MDWGALVGLVVNNAGDYAVAQAQPDNETVTNVYYPNPTTASSAAGSINRFYYVGGAVLLLGVIVVMAGRS